MLTFIKTEFLKLKRTKILTISLIGSLIVSLLLTLTLYYEKINNGPIDATLYLNYFNQYTLCMFGIMLITVISSYIFTREYTEHTLKTIMTIPIPRKNYILGKYLMFALWTIILFLISFTSSIILFSIFGANLTINLTLQTLKQLILGTILLIITFTPIILLTQIMKKSILAILSSTIIFL